MATAGEIRKFIEEIAPCAQIAYKRVGKVHPSVCIAMACVESAYGTSTKMRAHNAFMGQKVGTGKTATMYWDGKFFKTKTKEEYTVGVHTIITDAFRAYKNMQQCVLNYYELLNSPVYKDVTASASPKIQMLQIKKCKYMTSSTEVASVLSIIDRYQLTKYDNVEDHLKLCPYPEPKAAVKEGQKNVNVKWVQWMLNAIGKGYILKIDGVFGPITAGAVADFQKKKGIDVNMVVGKITRTKLKEALEEAKNVHRV